MVVQLLSPQGEPFKDANVAKNMKQNTKMFYSHGSVNHSVSFVMPPTTP